MVVTLSGETLLQIDRQVFAATFAQRHSWVLEQLKPESDLNTLSTMVHVRGTLTTEVLTKSLNELVQRHGALRANFQVLEGQMLLGKHITSRIEPLSVLAEHLSTCLSKHLTSS